MHPARVLVVYCTRSGSTAGVARSIAAKLGEHGHGVDVREIPDAPGPRDYDAIVLGSPVFDGRWMSDAEGYVEGQRDALRTRQVWLFSVGTFGDTKRLLGSPRTARAAEHRRCCWQPSDRVAIASSPGAVDRAAWPWWSRMLFHAIGGRFGDNRDPDVIDAWAAEIAAGLETTEAQGWTSRSTLPA